MRLLKVFVMTVVLLALVLAMENYTDWDVAVQNKLYFSDTGSWLITPEMHRQWDFVFYNGMKHFVAFWGTVSVLVMVAGFRIKSLRPKFAAALTVLLCTIIIPTSVNSLKKKTNVYCPGQLEIYNGAYPYVRVFEAYPKTFGPEHRGRCFPAGHVTGLFSLMALGYYFQNKKKRYAVIVAAFVLAWVGGAYQMMRGEHFLSHTLTTMVAVPLFIMLIHRAVLWGERVIGRLRVHGLWRWRRRWPE